MKARRLGRPIRPTKILVLGFMIVILVGAFFLMMPISSRARVWTPPMTALFTATSATCVTGLILVDTYSYWSGFGQTVIIVMIQIGGLGFMTLATMFSFILRRTITMRERMLMTTSLNTEDLSGIVRLTKQVLYGTFFFEGMGALILSIRFTKDFGVLEGIKKGVFHAISAFCNAGFDLMGVNKPFSSLIAYAGDFIVNATIMSLIVIGGLGFFVWGDLYKNTGKGMRQFELHTKIALLGTAFLIVFGAVLFFVFEFNNPMTMGNMTFVDKMESSFFQSVTARTAGFNTIDQSALTESSMALTIILMFIGGCPGSTAGGVKTVTVAVLIITAIAVMRGRSTPVCFGRSISKRIILNAVTMLFVGMTLVITGAVIICTADGIPLVTALYEAVSAFGTVGLSTGITAGLSTVSKMTLISLMYFGRVGVLTLGIAVFMRDVSQSKIQYPNGKVFIG